MHRTPYGRFLGWFNLFGIRWFTGCYGSIEAAEAAEALMRRRLVALVAQGWKPTGVREAEVEPVVLKG